MSKTTKQKALTAASRVIRYGGEPLVDFLQIASASAGEPGVLTAIIANAAKMEMDRAADALEEAGKSTHTDQGFEMVWKIAHKASVKPEQMKSHWRSLLRSAMDRSFPHEIRMEDIDFLDSLNPADAVFIEVINAHGEQMRQLHATNKNLAALIPRFGNSNNEYLEVAQRGFIDAQDVVRCYDLVHGTRCPIQVAEIATIIQTRSQLTLEQERTQNAILDIYGYVKNGMFRMKIEEQGNYWGCKMGSWEYPETYCVGHLSYQAKRVAALLAAAV